jgi:hypothetical protein
MLTLKFDAWERRVGARGLQPGPGNGVASINFTFHTGTLSPVARKCSQRPVTGNP